MPCCRRSSEGNRPASEPAMRAEVVGITTVYGLFAALFGGVLVKLIDGRTRLKTKQIDMGAELRDDLYREIEGLRSELAKSRDVISAIEKEREAWRARYYKSLEGISPLRAENRGLQEEVQHLTAKVKRMEESAIRKQK